MSSPDAPEASSPTAITMADVICRRIGGEAQQGVDELLRALRGEVQMPDSVDAGAFHSRWTAGEEALVDAETGASSPAAFRDRLRHSLARYFRYGTRFAVLYVRCTGAHPAAIARTVAAGLRSTDSVAAAGEGELAILLDTLAAPGDAAAVAARIRRQVTVGHAGSAVVIGIAHLVPHGTDAETVLWSAYGAMCRAHRFGAGRIEIANGES